MRLISIKRSCDSCNRATAHRDEELSVTACLTLHRHGWGMFLHLRMNCSRQQMKLHPGKGFVSKKLITSPVNNEGSGAAAFSFSHKHRDRASVGLNKYVAIKQMFLAQRLSFFSEWEKNGLFVWFSLYFGEGGTEVQRGNGAAERE